ncbi:hypothetical protein [Taylorella equigenitalis]|uniref:Uncharacterized protein n=3 Tax=Taylorella equigenitalis TaxID=29575 RepID=A0A654KJ43_TAYEM|nr:hypothetical protein [Taylorella equigenitalis]ADU92487.1 hypothetical protein TEQUI_1575 [Taylorella equigenitalis MCE9]AFN36036.1 hypothetical protein KUI_0964 [Taylorella equigenitalis ATCC 35865]ASY30668.1 hypothetical protein B9Z30_04700 [Taylorella equigenitalis]ASY37974.1 hypothetical protein CA605_04620 [Taylorella equigenitalis]ASY39450.1 hypothetical protein CA604_04850 [Taylorella equigenitalis]
MCGLCGLIAEITDWTDTLSDELPRRQERYRRIAIINAILKPTHIKVYDSQGVNYVLEGPTGRRELANGLHELWLKVELMQPSFDILDEAYLARLDA